ncbi:hypothetical protein GNP59_15150 [Aliivibrio fischeri]|nr:hypothetical protein [Aliivibrio fischeri]MUL14263.1 hypothetical protein [Aliivibrio fischeri]
MMNKLIKLAFRQKNDIIYFDSWERNLIFCELNEFSNKLNVKL